MAAKEAPSALVVATRAADGGCCASHSKVGTAYAAPRGQKKVTSTRVGPAEYFELSSDDGRPTGEERPAALLERWPQGKLMRHTNVGYEIVQSLDVPVPQMGEQLPSVLQFFASHLPMIAEQVIDVPKIIMSFPFALSGTADGGTGG